MLILLISSVYCAGFSSKRQKLYNNPFSRDIIKEAEDISLVYRLSHIDNPSSAYLPQLRKSYLRLEANPAIKKKKRFLETATRAFFNLEDFCSIKKVYEAISLWEFKTSEAIGRLRRFVEHLLKREDDPAILNDLWRNTHPSVLYKLSGFVYALDWEGIVSDAYERFDSKGFDLSFELISNDFNEEQRRIMYENNVQIIEANFGSGRLKDELLLKNNIRYGTIDEARLLAEVNTIFLKKGIALALFLERRVDLFNEIFKPNESPNLDRLPFERIDMPRFEDVFLERPDLLDRINVIDAQQSVQELFARAIILKTSQIDPSSSAIEQFLLSRRGKVLVNDATLHNLQMCSFYSRTEEEFAQVLDMMNVIPTGELFNFIFSKLSMGNETNFLRITCRKYEENPDKFSFRDGNRLSIAPFYKYFDDGSVNRIIFKILDEFVEYKKLSADDILSIINSPAKIIPNFLRGSFKNFEPNATASVIVSLNSKTQAQRLIDLFGTVNIRQFIENAERSNKYLTPASKHIIFRVFYECNPKFLS